MGLKIVTPPATEPISVAEAKVHLRVDHDTEDALIAAFITAAREECEHMVERALAPQTLSLSIDEFPDDGIRLLRPPVTGIVSVAYVDGDGDTQTIDAGDVYLDDAQDPCWLMPRYGTTWPAARGDANSVVVTYQAGYNDCPETLRAWMLLRIGVLYRMRESASDKPAVNHGFVDRLLDRYRIWGV